VADLQAPHNDVPPSETVDLTPEVYAAAGKAMVPWGDDEDAGLFEWHHCRDNPNCRGETGPCSCAGMPWPSEPVRAAIDVAYWAGREAAAQAVEANVGYHECAWGFDAAEAARGANQSLAGEDDRG
jgi:hypothetical protein